MPHWGKIAILVAGVLLLASVPLAMQREPGSIQGIITDQNGPVPNASIEARRSRAQPSFMPHPTARAGTE